MEDPDLKVLLEILKLQTQMVYETWTSAEALKRLLQANPSTANMLARLETEVKAEVSEPYTLALELIGGMETKLKGPIQ